MELKGSKTEEVLCKAGIAELRASFEYNRYAEIARQSGLPQIAEIFEAVARNEMEHAIHEYNFLGEAGDVVENLTQALSNEHEQVMKYYPEAAQVAEAEGFTEIADFFRRVVKVEAVHEKEWQTLLGELEKGAEFRGRTAGHSALEMAQLMLPAQANPAGFVHGGELMKLMDNAAGVVAARHAHANVVTAGVEDIIFKHPVLVGSLVIVHARLVFTSHSTMDVRVEVVMESKEQMTPVLTANYVMVALDGQGKPASIPELILLTEEEERLFAEAQESYKARKKRTK